MNFAAHLSDELTGHDLDLLRVEASQLQTLLARLVDLHAAILVQIKAADITGPTRRGDQIRRYEKLRVDIERQIDATYRALSTAHRAALTAMAASESQAVAAIVRSAAEGVPLLARTVPKARLAGLVDNLLVPADATGQPVIQLWGLQRDSAKLKVRAALRQAVERTQTLSDLLQVVRGNKALRYRDGILPRSKAQAEALVRTAQSQVVNAARWSTYQANAETVKGVQAQAVLDGRTTILCRTRNGKAWLLDGAAFPPLTGRVPTIEPFPGPPPWHWRCRSTLVPIFFDLESLQATVEPRLHELIVKMDGQFSYDGQPSLVRTFDAWMGTRTEAQQIAAIGRGRWELWQDDKIGLSDLLDQRGREMTLRDLRTKLNLDDEE